MKEIKSLFKVKSGPTTGTFKLVESLSPKEFGERIKKAIPQAKKQKGEWWGKEGYWFIVPTSQGDIAISYTVEKKTIEIGPTW